MKMTRRSVLKAAGLAAALPSLRAYAWLDTKPSPRTLAGIALKAATDAGASYADARIVRRTAEWISSRDDAVHGIDRDVSRGIGVRVLKRGAWGFAATPDLSEAGIKLAVARAIALAEASAAILSAPIQLAPEPAHEDSWQTPIQKDPFRVPLARKVALLRDINKAARGAADLASVQAYLGGASEEKTFFSTEGSAIEQQIFRVDGGYGLAAVDSKTGVFETRRFPTSCYGAGFEHLERIGLVERAPELARQVREKLTADTPKAGPTDLGSPPTTCGSRFTSPSATPPSWTACWATRPASRAPASPTSATWARCATAARTPTSWPTRPRPEDWPPALMTTTA